MKTKLTHKLFALLLSVIMVVGLLPVAAFAEDGEATTVAYGSCGEGLDWTLDSEGTLTISGTGDMSDYYYTSNVYKAPWYHHTKSILNVVIEPGVTSIGGSAFNDCSVMKTISIPESVTSIGMYAFRNCWVLEAIDIPARITSIGYAAFYNCYKITSMVLPDGITSIGGYTFHGCSALESVNIPSRVTSIENWTFYNCSNLKSIDLPAGVTSIGEYAFCNCWDLENVILPAGVTEIGMGAFEKCSSFTTITIPSGVTEISGRLFYECRNLVSVTLPESIEEIIGYAFYGCRALTDINIPAGVTTIGERAFCSCVSLPEITLPAGLTSIKDYAFSCCEILPEIDIPSTVTNIGSGAFESCRGFTNVIIPNGITEIKDHVFSGCTNLESVTIPYGVTSIGDTAFNSCEKLTDIDIPASVTTIGYSAFRGCNAFTSVTVPEGVTFIGFYAFAYCENLESVSLPESLTYLGDYAFISCSSLTSVNIPYGLTSIPAAIFSGCTSLPGVTIPDTVTNIGSGAFADCTAMTEIHIPDGVTSLGSSAFRGCTGLTEIIIPDNVTSIEGACFQDCTGITSITVPEGVTFIDQSTFMGCTNLIQINLPADVTYFGYYAFRDCSSLTRFTVPAAVTSIGERAFMNCSTLNKIIFTGSAPTFGTNVFQGVTATAYYPADDETWTASVRQSYGGRITWKENIIDFPEDGVQYNYNGEVQTAISGDFVATGDYEAVNVGNYTAFVTPAYGLVWSDTKTSEAREINWSILPYPVTIRPNNAQKYQGYEDGELTYSTNISYGSTLDGIFKSSVQGALVREPGEDLGQYLITMGTLSAGDNFTLTLSDTPAYLYIEEEIIEEVFYSVYICEWLSNGEGSTKIESDGKVNPLYLNNLPEGTEVTVTYTPAVGETFEYWTIGFEDDREIVSYDAVYTFSLNDEAWLTPVVSCCEHVYDTTVFPPSCTLSGCTYKRCTLCGKDVFESIVPSLGHIDENDDDICDRCGAPMSRYEKISTTDDLVLNGKYILVVEIDGQHYAMGKTQTDYAGEKLTLPAISAVPVTVEEDGTIKAWTADNAGAMQIILGRAYYDAFQDYLRFSLSFVGDIVSGGSDDSGIDDKPGTSSDGLSGLAGWYGLQIISGMGDSKYGFYANEYTEGVTFSSMYTANWSENSGIIKAVDDDGTVKFVNTNGAVTAYVYRLVEKGIARTSNGSDVAYVVEEKPATVTVNVDIDETDFNTETADNINGVTDVANAIINEVIESNLDAAAENSCYNVTICVSAEVTLENYYQSEEIGTSFVLYDITPNLSVISNDGTVISSVEISDSQLNGNGITVTLYTGTVYPAQVVHQKTDGTNEYFYVEWSDEVQLYGKKSFTLYENSMYDENGYYIGAEYAVSFTVSEFSNIYVYDTPIEEEASNSAHSVIGSVISFGDDSSPVTVILTEQGQSKPLYETTVIGRIADFAFDDVLDGTYTLTVKKYNHVTCNYTVTVEGADAVQEVIMHLLGDLDGDGAFTSQDLILACQLDAGLISVDEEVKAFIDVDGNGIFDAADLINMCQYDAGIITSWPHTAE